MRLILAEDDAVLGNAMQKALIRSAFAVDWVRTGREFRQAVAVGSYEFALLDLSLPDAAGESLLQHVRDKASHLPVIIVTGRRDVHDKVNLLEMGADDYVVKPFDLTELVARVRTVLRRSPANDADADADALSHGALRLIPHRNAASWYGIPVELTRHEYCVLEALARRKGQVLTRAQLEDSIYRWGKEVESNAIEVYVHRLRRKFSPDLIETVRGVGYQLASTGLNA
jgi:two-component system response regulator QseB